MLFPLWFVVYMLSIGTSVLPRVRVKLHVAALCSAAYILRLVYTNANPTYTPWYKLTLFLCLLGSSVYLLIFTSCAATHMFEGNVIVYCTCMQEWSILIEIWYNETLITYLLFLQISLATCSSASLGFRRNPSLSLPPLLCPALKF